MLPSTWARPLAEIRVGGGPSALEASCIPEPHHLATNLSAFMPVSSNSRAAAHLLLHPCNFRLAHRRERECVCVLVGGLEEWRRIDANRNRLKIETNGRAKREWQKERQMYPEKGKGKGRKHTERLEFRSTFSCRIGLDVNSSCSSPDERWIPD